MSLKRKVGAALFDLMMKRPEKAGLSAWRRETLSQAAGYILEIGSGTGVNLSLYPKSAGNLVALDPNPEMAARMDLDSYTGSGSVEFLKGYAHELPFDDASFDTVVTTMTLCSVDDPLKTLKELRRVLHPDGHLLFLEHVASAHEPLRKWQERVNPIWNRFTGNCHINRDTASTIKAAGFHLIRCKFDPMPAVPPLIRPTIRGSAVPTSPAG